MRVLMVGGGVATAATSITRNFVAAYAQHADTVHVTTAVPRKVSPN